MLNRRGVVLLESRRSTLPLLSGPLSSLTNCLIPTHYHRTTRCTLPLNTCLTNHVLAKNNKYRLENVIYETKKGFRPLTFRIIAILLVTYVLSQVLYTLPCLGKPYGQTPLLSKHSILHNNTRL
jgi:hypothetical protein